MYSNYGITLTDAPNCVRSGEYNGVESPYLSCDNQTGNFAVIRNHSQRERILQIDAQLIAVNEEYKALSGNLSTASDAVKDYIQTRIAELKDSLNALELERSRLLAIMQQTACHYNVIGWQANL